MANGVPSVNDLINPGPDSISDVVPNSPFSFGNFAPILSAGSGIFSALQGDVGGALAGVGGALGSILGGPIGGIAGSFIGGGVGSLIRGGGRSVRPGFPATDPSSLEGTFLEDFSVPGGSAVQGRSFRQGATNLALEIQFTNPALDREANLFRSLGFNDLADDLLAEQKKLFNPTPSSQAAGRAQNQQLLNLLGTSIKLRNSIFDTALASPELSAQFEESTGISINDFAGEIDRQDQVFLQSFELKDASGLLQKETKALTGVGTAPTPAGQRVNTQGPSNIENLISQRDEIAGFTPVRKSQRGGGGEIIGYRRTVGGGQRGIGSKIENISVSEFNQRNSNARSEIESQSLGSRRNQVQTLSEFADAPGLDISNAQAGFGSLFNTFVGTPAGQQPLVGVAGGTGTIAGQQPLQPADPNDPTQQNKLPNIPISQLLKLLPQNQQEQEQPDFSLPSFDIPQFDFREIGLGNNFNVESTLGGGNLIQDILGAPQQSLEGATGQPFTPTGGNLFSSKQNAPKGLAFLS